MNSRIYSLLLNELEKSFNLPKYSEVKITKHTVVMDLPWTPVRLEKFKETICEELNFDSILLDGTLEQIVKELDTAYTGRFFGEIWQPTTDSHIFSGWSLVDQVNALQPKKVLDYGCGYNQFKGKVDNLIGIDLYNDAADYMIDIFDFKVQPESFDVILVLGSLNFNTRDEIERRLEELLKHLKPSGKMFMRVNPGVSWGKGKYVDIFPWTFEIAWELAEKFGLELENFKRDPGEHGIRYFFTYKKKMSL